MRNVEYIHSRKCHMSNVTYSLYIGYMICDMYFIMHTNDEKGILIQNNAQTI